MSHPTFALPITAPENHSVAVQISFRNLPTSPAVAALIELEAQTMGRRFAKITHCHVVVASPYGHRGRDCRFSVHIEFGVPHGPIVATYEPASRTPAKKSAHARTAAASDLYTVVRDTFATARRQLEDHFSRLRGQRNPSLVS